MAKNRVKEAHIVHTCKTIFETDLFINSLKAKERYGVRLLEITDEKIERFVKLAYNAFIDIKTYNKKLSMTKVFLALLGNEFYELLDNANVNDILVMSYKDFINKSSAEGAYAFNLLKMFKLEENNQNISLFNKNKADWFGA